MTPKEIADRASHLISGERNRTHGNARDNFENIGALWNGYLQRVSGGRHLTVKDVANLMTLLKIARTMAGAHNVDDYIDACGYMALGGGLSEEDAGAGSAAFDLPRPMQVHATCDAWKLSKEAEADLAVIEARGRCGKWDVT